MGTLSDNFEWEGGEEAERATQGSVPRFGLFQTDFDEVERLHEKFEELKKVSSSKTSVSPSRSPAESSRTRLLAAARKTRTPRRFVLKLAKALGGTLKS